jgi:hypothetical protein
MSTGLIFRRFSGVLLVCAAVLCAGGASEVQGSPTQSHRKTKKQPPPPLPSGPTGPVQQIPLDSIAAVPPQVSYQGSQLTIVAPNSTLADILRAVRKQTGAEIEIPAAPERVVTHLGPGPARDVLAELLNGSRFNYVLLGSPGNETMLTRVVLVPKTGQSSTPAPAPDTPAGVSQAANAPPADQDAQPDANDAEANDETNADDNADQAAEAEQPPAAAPDQPGVKTPQQMLQEMQQRQLQMQQQQPAGQPPVPGSGVPPRPPQEQ